MKILFIVNDTPYGTERSWNALRTAKAITELNPAPEVSVFLLSDAVYCALKGQEPATTSYELGAFVSWIAEKGRVLACGMCMDARGVKESDVVEGCEKSTLSELARLTVEADNVVVF
jgi:uncharacterized protein involved in oxidation of intracellular sulfur